MLRHVRDGRSFLFCSMEWNISYCFIWHATISVSEWLEWILRAYSSYIHLYVYAYYSCSPLILFLPNKIRLTTSGNIKKLRIYSPNTAYDMNEKYFIVVFIGQAYTTYMEMYIYSGSTHDAGNKRNEKGMPFTSPLCIINTYKSKRQVFRIFQSANAGFSLQKSLITYFLLSRSRTLCIRNNKWKGGKRKVS